MTREEARKRAEVMMAFANGSDVQFYNGSTEQWEDLAPECVLFDSKTEYRIKQEPKYRPFKSQEECWNEMHKHPDFGWIKEKDTGNFVNIGYIDIQLSKGSIITLAPTENFEYSSLEVFNYYTFTDDKPFGIKEE